MSPPKHRFSRRFLNMLILVTAIAILVLSKMGQKESSVNEAGSAPTSQNNNP